MFFHKKDKDVRLTDEEYKRLVGGMSKKERKDFDRRQKDLRREREGDMLDAWLDFEDDMDDRGLQSLRNSWSQGDSSFPGCIEVKD